MPGRAHAHARKHARTHARTHAHTQTCALTHTHTHTNTCIYGKYMFTIRVCLCVCRYISTDIFRQYILANIVPTIVCLY